MYARRYFPTFYGFPDRPEAPSDVMLTNDSWLAAVMTDEVIFANREEIDDVDYAPRWQFFFGKILGDLQFFGWRESCRLHLS